MTSIDMRPPELAARIVQGHWEGDLIKGARNASAAGTIVERASRSLMLVQLDDAGLQRQFCVEQPNQAWLTDITYIRTHEGWLCLAGVVAQVSRQVVGWWMGSRIDTALGVSLGCWLGCPYCSARKGHGNDQRSGTRRPDFEHEQHGVKGSFEACSSGG